MKIKTLFLVIFFSTILFSQYPKFEVRAVWISTASGDWPKTTNVEEQQRSIIEMFDLLHQKNFNTVYFQVRPRGNAFYRSSIEPWAQQLTGVLGKDPDWDPLEFAIDEAHKRGMELHAWFNVGKVWGASDLPTNPKHVTRAHRDWVQEVEGEWWIDMGIPEAREYTERVVMDLVKKYDIDGLQFDFVRYPDGQFNDWKMFSDLGEGKSRDEWRRDNITEFVRDCYSDIQKIKPKVKIGSSPIGIYQSIKGAQSSFAGYSAVYQDSRRWLREGIHDYLVPQLYWSLGEQNNPNDPDFEALCEDWANENYGRHIYAGIGIYKENIQGEVKEQIEISRAARTQGEAFFRFENLHSVIGQIDRAYRFPALPPPMVWKDSVPPLPPVNISVDIKQNSDVVVQWEDPEPASDHELPFWYVVYRSTDSLVDIRKAENILAVLPADRHSYRDERTGGMKFFYTVTSFDRCGNESSVDTKSSGETFSLFTKYTKPEEGVSLSQNYPNPFTEKTYIAYELPVKSYVMIRAVQSDSGRDTVLLGKTMNPGSHIMMIDGREFKQGSIEYELQIGNTMLSKVMEKKTE